MKKASLIPCIQTSTNQRMYHLPHAVNSYPRLTCRIPFLFLKEELELTIFPINKNVAIDKYETFCNITCQKLSSKFTHLSFP